MQSSRQIDLELRPVNTMRKVFWDNPYQNILETTVLEVNTNEILLSETIAYHQSGGQASDRSVINGMPVLSSRFTSNDDHSTIWYTLGEGHGLAIGDKVTMEIDWPTRYKLMRLHFCCEMVLEIITKLYDLEKTGADMQPHKARVDFIYADNISELFEVLQREFTRVVNADLPIEKDYQSIEKGLRFWRVNSFWGEGKPAQIPCGGTHCNTTGEIGEVNFKRSKSGKVNRVVAGQPVRLNAERIEITLKDESAPNPMHEPRHFKMG